MDYVEERSWCFTRPPLTLLMLAAAAAAACDDELASEPASPATLSIEKAPTNSGDGQTDTVLARLAPFRVLVRHGAVPARDIAVSWVVSGLLSDSPNHVQSRTTHSDASGIASLTLTFERSPGQYTVEASLSVPDAVGSPVTFVATATPGRPAVLGIVSGNNQIDTAKARLSTDYRVQVTDRHDNGVGGLMIDWAVTAGGGSISPTRNTTEPSGHASARHTLGPGPGPQTVTATATALLGASPAAFTALVLGSLRVTTTTTGVDLDPNGYGVTADGATADRTASVLTNGTETISKISPGDYIMTLGDVAVNCDPAGPNPLTVTVPSGGTAVVTFDVVCAAARQLALNFGNDIYLVKVNGAGLAQLTTHAAVDVAPTWSPDGSKIAFESYRDGNAEIYVMNADGSNPIRLTNNQASDAGPDWSPDGSRIAFMSNRDGNAEIYVMSADGSNPIRLTNNQGADAEPHWSPDGTRLAFHSNRDGNFEIYAMNPDGSGATRLTNDPAAAQPDWSPDGARLVFSRSRGCDYYQCYTDLVVINADGSGARTLTSGSNDFEAAWSPDGRWIAFGNSFTTCDYYYGCYTEYAVVVVQPDGSRRTHVASGASQPAWRP